MTKYRLKLVILGAITAVVLGVLVFAISPTSSNDCPPVNDSCKACVGTGYTMPNAIYDCPTTDGGMRIKKALLATSISLPILLLLAVASSSRLSKKQSKS